MSTLLTSLEESLSVDSRPILHDGNTWSTASELQRDAKRLQEILIEEGVNEQEKVLIGLPNSYDFVVAYLALLQGGMVIVPVNPHMPAAELDRVMARVDAKAILMTEEQAVKWEQALTKNGYNANASEGLRDSAESDHASVVVRVTSKGPTQTVDEKHQGTLDDDAPAVLMFTSGTTGQPKGVLLRRRHLLHAAHNVMKSHQLTNDDVAYCILPLFHINAQVIVLLSTILSGGKLVMKDKFHGSCFWADVENHRVTWVSAVPTILSILSKQTAETRKHHLRFIRSASAPLSPAIKARFERAIGVPVIESYGMTEAAGQICINPLTGSGHKAGSVGKPFGLELEILDDSKRRVGPREVGEIVIRGHNVIEGYVGMEDPHSGSEWAGWIFTGDLGYRDEDGYVFITGRAKEIINRAGEKLSPREIEDVLNGHPAVRRSAVIGVPDPLYGERVVAFVVPIDDAMAASDTLASELSQVCLESLARHKCPSEFFIAKSLPVGPTGKVQKHLLKQGGIPLAAGPASSPAWMTVKRAN